MTETHEQRVERLARAAYETNNTEWDPAWWRIDEGMREAFRKFVRRLIASDRAAGYVTVPVSALKQALLALPWAHLTRSEIQAAIAAHEQEERQDAP